MSEEGHNPLFSPPLRRHRLVRAGDAALPPDMPGAADAGQEWTIGSGFPNAAPPAPLLAAQAKLAEEATRLVQEIMPGLEVLQTALSARGTAERIVETLLLVCSALRVLPGELASGAAASVARVDWIFARLLNAPGEPGLIEQVLLALSAPAPPVTGTGGNPVPALSPTAPVPEPPMDAAAEQEMLRRLHRNLVTLQQGWEDMLELTLPPEMFEPAPPLALPVVDEASLLPEEAPVAPPPMTPAPLPAGLVVAHPGGTWRASARVMRSRPGVLSANPSFLAMAVIVLVLVLTGGGVYLMQSLRAQPVSPNNAAVIAPVPSPTATAPTQPTATPTATATATATATSTPKPRPTATSTPLAPTATPSPSAGPLCASGAQLCASVSSLYVPCVGQNGVTFQLTNTGPDKLFWAPISSTINGTSLVSVSPTGGSLRSGNQVTVTVSAHAHGQGLKGTLTIMIGFQNNQSLVIALQVC